jgi:hypothetical protein
MKPHDTMPTARMNGRRMLTAFAILALGLMAWPFLWLWGGMAGLFAGLMTVAAAFVGAALLSLVGRDARRALPKVHGEHRRERPEPDGDLTDVAGAPDLPPWMGGPR